jgi:hypothetical protein
MPQDVCALLSGQEGMDPVSSRRPYSRAKGAATSAGAFPTVPLYGQAPRAPRRSAKGPYGTPCVSSPVLEEGGPSLVDCTICVVLVWWC